MLAGWLTFLPPPNPTTNEGAKREQKKRLCSAVILAGGSSQFPGLREVLESKYATLHLLLQAAAAAAAADNLLGIYDPNHRINEAVPSSWAQEDNVGEGGRAEVSPARRGSSSTAACGPAVEVLASRRKDMELDSRFLSWKGGAIAACLEATRELWITAAQWCTHGERHLRERAAFSW